MIKKFKNIIVSILAFFSVNDCLLVCRTFHIHRFIEQCLPSFSLPLVFGLLDSQLFRLPRGLTDPSATSDAGLDSAFIGSTSPLRWADEDKAETLFLSEI